jgi:hypothetical protein
VARRHDTGAETPTDAPAEDAAPEPAQDWGWDEDDPGIDQDDR